MSAQNVAAILESHAGAGRDSLIPILQEVQESEGYLSKDSVTAIGRHLDLPASKVFGVATFYNQFRFVPPGHYPIKVCMGTACHIKGGVKVLEHWQRSLDIAEGEVSPDREYSLDRVACVGCCTLAPVTLIKDEVIGDMSPTKVDGILLQHRLKREQEKGDD